MSEYSIAAYDNPTAEPIAATSDEIGHLMSWAEALVPVPMWVVIFQEGPMTTWRPIYYGTQVSPSRWHWISIEGAYLRDNSAEIE